MTRFLVALTVLAVSGSAIAEPAVDRAAEVVAQALAEAVVARNEEAVTVLFAHPANLDGEMIMTMQELESRWAAVLDRAEVRGLRLTELEVIPLEVALDRYGPPPRRLGELPTEDVLVAILRFDRAMVVAVLARREGRWAIIALTD